MERIKSPVIEGLLDILLKIATVAAKSLIIVPLLCLFSWLTERHLPSHDEFGFFFVGGLIFSDVSDKTRQRFLRHLHGKSRKPAEVKPL